MSLSHPKIPSQFLEHLLQSLVGFCDSNAVVDDLCFEEMAFLLTADAHFQFPFWNPNTKAMELSTAAQRYERPTLSYFLSILRQSFAVLIRLCDDFSSVLFQDRNKVALGIYRPCKGLYLRLRPDLVQQVCTRVLCFTAARPIRKACDTARPL